MSRDNAAAEFARAAEDYAKTYEKGKLDDWEQGAAILRRMQDNAAWMADACLRDGTLRVLIVCNVGGLILPPGIKFQNGLIRFVNAYKTGQKNESELLDAIKMLDESAARLSEIRYRSAGHTVVGVYCAVLDPEAMEKRIAAMTATPTGQA